jgi:hypothetical protein
MMRRIFFLTGLLALTAAMTSAHVLKSGFAGQSSAAGQSAKGKADERGANSITGRVVNDAGQPIVNAAVRANLIGKPATNRLTSTDDEGKFRLEELARGVYYVSTYAPGYTSFNNFPYPKFYRVGDTINITLIKGGVITGTVTNSSGEPMVAVRVAAIRVRDLEGHAISILGPGGQWRTDDRGVFRIYGLPPGVYIVFASGSGFSMREPTAYDEDIPTYHPSSTRDAATPVTVHQGEELSGVDIRYRGERGHAISGNIAGAPASNRNSFIDLVNMPSNQTMGQYYMGGDRPNLAFAFYGLPDGEYYVIARRYGEEQEVGGVGRIRVKVKGADVTGLEIPITSYGSIAGRITIERISATDQNKKCESKRGMSFDEALISVNRDQKADSKDELYSRLTSFLTATPNSKGEFTITNIEAGGYHVTPGSISDDLYIRAVTLAPVAQNRPPVDASRNGLTLKTGERIAAMTVTLAEGAAGLRGRVVAATEGERLPDRLKAHLVPAEKEAAEDTLRFAEAAVQSDGTFSIKNVAPGRYFLIARPLPDEEATDRLPRHVAWDAEGRKALRQEAEQANVVLELQPCQRIADHVLRYTPPAAKPAATRKQ